MPTSEKMRSEATFEQEFADWKTAYEAYGAAFERAKNARNIDCADVRTSFDLADQIFDRASRLMPKDAEGMRDYLDMVSSWDISESPSEVNRSFDVFRRWLNIQASATERSIVSERS